MNYPVPELPSPITFPVGRRMDFDVATRVLKLSVGSKYSYNSGDEIFFTDAEPYSTNIISAMKVLQVLQNKEFMWSINGSSGGGFWCVLYPPFGDNVGTKLFPTPEEAICQAALSLNPEILDILIPS